MQNELYIVADAIKALRESRGLTQEQLAEKADISVSHLAKIETHPYDAPYAAEILRKYEAGCWMAAGNDQRSVWT